MLDFDAVYAAHHRAIERYIRYRIGDGDAEDVLQEVFSAAAACSALPEDANVQAWLVGIARNKCADYFRRKYRRSEVPL